jgi:hypothetical protein
MKAECDVGHSRTKRLARDGGIVDRGHGRKNAGKERMQRAAKIGVIACTSARMGTPVIAMAVGVMAISVVVTGMRDRGAHSRVGCCERRRDDAGELRKYEQCDQCADKTGYCPEPLHQFDLARTVATG